MSLDADAEVIGNSYAYERARTWATIAVTASTVFAMIWILIGLVAQWPSDALAVDAAREISGQSFIFGLCVLMSLINAYAVSQLARAIGVRV